MLPLPSRRALRADTTPGHQPASANWTTTRSPLWKHDFAAPPAIGWWTRNTAVQAREQAWLPELWFREGQRSLSVPPTWSGKLRLDVSKHPHEDEYRRTPWLQNTTGQPRPPRRRCEYPKHRACTTRLRQLRTRHSWFTYRPPRGVCVSV